MTLAEALKSFQDHAAVNYPQTQRQADRALEVLKKYPPGRGISALGSARGRATPPCREGRAELDRECARIRRERGL